jgi:glycosidase
MPMKVKLLICFNMLLALTSAVASPTGIERLDPPHWWTGFEERSLQLLIYGEGIASHEPEIDYPGVSIDRTERVENPNYLFLYLTIDPSARPGAFDIRFVGEARTLSHRYELYPRDGDPSHTPGFDSSDAIYLITPDRFANGDVTNDRVGGMGDLPDRGNPGGRHGGDIQGIIDHLDYIENMGFTAIWLNPVLENAMPAYSYHGYATTDFYRVDPRFGSNELYRELVATAKSKGIGVIMDMIVNHIGGEHWWMDDLPDRDWIHFLDSPEFTSREHITVPDPNAATADRRMFTDGWFDHPMPDLNQRNTLLADYLIQNSLWWIEYLGLAGVRMDTYPYPDKQFMSEWARRVLQEFPSFNIVGEVMTSNAAELAYWQRGQSNHDGYVSHLPSLMDFPLQDALRWGLSLPEGTKTKDLRDKGLLSLYRALADDFVYSDPRELVVFPDNHDLSRVYTQLGEDYDLFRMAMAFVLTVRGVPQIFYGTEILMSNKGTEDHGVIRSDFPGGWPEDTANAFTGAGLDARQLEARQFIRTLLHWRRDTPVLHTGQLMHFRPENGVYVLFRYDSTATVMLVLNKNEAAIDLPLERFQERLQGVGAARDVLSGEVVSLAAPLRVPGRSPMLLELTED